MLIRTVTMYTMYLDRNISKMYI